MSNIPGKDGYVDLSIKGAKPRAPMARGVEPPGPPKKKGGSPKRRPPRAVLHVARKHAQRIVTDMVTESSFYLLAFNAAPDGSLTLNWKTNAFPAASIPDLIGLLCDEVAKNLTANGFPLDLVKEIIAKGVAKYVGPAPAPVPVPEPETIDEAIKRDPVAAAGHIVDAFGVEAIEPAITKLSTQSEPVIETFDDAVSRSFSEGAERAIDTAAGYDSGSSPSDSGGGCDGGSSPGE